MAPVGYVRPLPYAGINQIRSSGSSLAGTLSPKRAPPAWFSIRISVLV